VSIPGLVKSGVKAGLIILLLFYLVRSVAANWDTVSAYDWSFDPVLMSLAAALFTAGYVFLPWIWRRVLESTGHTMSFGDAWDIYYIGNLGRYIPGKVWMLLGVSYLAAKRGIPKDAAAATAILAQMYSLLSSVVFFFFFFIFTGMEGTSERIIWMMPPMACMLVCSLYPDLLVRMANALLRRFGRNPLAVNISRRAALGLTLLYFISWVVMGCAFGFFVAAIAGPGEVSIPAAAVMYVVAYAVGFLALFAPGGIGVREGMLAAMLGPYLPVSVAILIAALSRLLVTVIELLCVAVTIFRRGLAHVTQETP
jgi:glycosyltransferase 2 family protein